MATDQNASGAVARTVEFDGDDGIDRFARDGVILAHADPAVAAMVDHAVGKPPISPRRGRCWCERLRLGCAARQSIQAAVGEIGEIDASVRHHPRSAAVFVHARARVVGRRRDVGRRSVAGVAHDHVAALLLRPPFQPIDIVAVEPHVRQRNGLRDNQLRCDRRLPGAVGRGLRGGGRHGECALSMKSFRPCTRCCPARAASGARAACS